MTDIMRKVAIVASLALACLNAAAQTGTLPRSTPIAENVDPKAITSLIDSLMAMPDAELHHLVVMRHGKVIAEAHAAPFRQDDVHTLYSVSKTLTCLAVGIAYDRNLLRPADRVATLLPHKMPHEVSPELAAMTVHELLTMTSGIKPNIDFSTESDDWLATFFAKPIDEPGRFHYDTMCTFALGAIVERVTGQRLLDFLKANLFAPMGIEIVDWETGPEGLCCAGYGLRLQAESMAKIGQLLLQKGRWEGRQLVSREWVDIASKKQTNYKFPGNTQTDTNQGYCYQMWRCLLPGAFRADGAYGQFIIVAPEQDMVVAMCGVSTNTRAELRHIWQQLFAGVDKQGTKSEEKHLFKLCQKLSLPTLEGKKHSPKAPKGVKISVPEGQIDDNSRNYKEIAVATDNNIYNLTVTLPDGEKQDFNLGYNGWAENTTKVAPPYHNGAKPINLNPIPGLTLGYKAAANYAWTSPTTIKIKIAWNNWIATQEITINLPGSLGALPTAVVVDNYPK